MLSYMLLNCSPGSEKEEISEISSVEGVVEVDGIFEKYDRDAIVNVENVGRNSFVSITVQGENTLEIFGIP